MLKFFISIKTYLWVTGIAIGIFLMGSLYIPKNLAIFSGINDMPLVTWLSENSYALNKLYWIYGLLGIILLLWIITLVCSLDAIIKRTTWRAAVRILSPQVLHIAVLLVVLGHGISAVSGYKHDVPMKMSETFEARGFSMKISSMDFFKNPGENSTRWRAQIEIDDRPHVLEVGRPVFYKNVGFFAKSAQKRKQSAIIGLVYDPGVIWEIIGAIVFVIGAGGVFYTKLNERVPVQA